MGKCLHYDTEKQICNKDGKGCKHRKNDKRCAKNGQIEEKHDDFRLIPTDRISPF